MTDTATNRPWLNFHAGKVIEYYASIDDALTLAEQVATRTLADVTASDRGDWYGSQRKLAVRVGVNRSTWARAIQRLVERGVIERYAERQGSKPARYSIMPWLYAGEVTLLPPARWNPAGSRFGCYESLPVEQATVATPEVLDPVEGQEEDFFAHETESPCPAGEPRKGLLDPVEGHITNKEREASNPDPYGATSSPASSALTDPDLPVEERKQRSIQALIANETEKTAIENEGGVVHG